MRRAISVVIGIAFLGIGIGTAVLSIYWIIRGQVIWFPVIIASGSILATGLVIITKGDLKEAFRVLFFVLRGTH